MPIPIWALAATVKTVRQNAQTTAILKFVVMSYFV